MEFSLAQVAATTSINLSLAWITGVLASQRWLSNGTVQWRAAVRGRLTKAMTAGLAACLTSVALSLWIEAATMGDVPLPEAAPALLEMFASTHYGHAGLAALAALALAMTLHWRLAGVDAARQIDRPNSLIAVLMLLVAMARVSIGHAVEHGAFSIAAWVEWMHLLFMAVWVGTVFIAGWVVLPLAARSLSEQIPATYLRALSRWATVALMVILVTGSANAYRMLGSAQDLFDGDYGRVLACKLLLVTTAIFLGGCNRFIYLPVSASAQCAWPEKQRSLRAMTAILRLESTVLLLALIAAAILSNSAPPA